CALDDLATSGFEARPVEGMRHRADEPLDGAAGQSSVGIEGDDVANPGRHDGARGHDGGVRRPTQEAIQLVELAALSLPSHPRLLAVVPEPPPVEEKESDTALGRGAVTAIQTLDTVARR